MARTGCVAATAVHADLVWAIDREQPGLRSRYVVRECCVQGILRFQDSSPEGLIPCTASEQAYQGFL